MNHNKTRCLSFLTLVVLLAGILGVEHQAAGASQPGDPGSAIQGAPRDQIDPERPLRPARGRDPETVEAKLSTPELIDKAYEQGEISADERALYLAYAVYEYASLPAQFRSLVPWWGTEVVAEVYQAAGLAGSGIQIPMSAFVQSELERLLFPQDATVCDQEDGVNYTDTTNFHINYQSIAVGQEWYHYTDALETTYSTIITSYGWAKPPLCTGGTCPDNPWDRYPVQIAALAPGLYGYTTKTGGSYTGFIGDNPDTTAVETQAYASCMVLNRDYSIYAPAGLGTLWVTTAHEFVHAIQFGLGDPGVKEGGIFYESIAAYMEDEVFDSINTNTYNLFPNFTSCLGKYNGNPLSNWLIFRYAAERTGGARVSGGGEDVAQGFWSNVSSGQTGLGAYENALAAKGANLNDIYHDYAITIRYMKKCPTGEPYCFEQAEHYWDFINDWPLPRNQGNIYGTPGIYYGNLQNHYAANWVGLPVSGVYTVTLQNNSKSGLLKGSIIANWFAGVQVTDLPGLVGGGGSTTLSNYSPPPRTTEVAIAITNLEKTSDNPSNCAPANYSISLNQTPPIPGDIHTYLPVVVKNEETLSGVVTDGGVPVLDEEVFLRYYDGFDWFNYAVAYTNANGYYAFTDLPKLDEGQVYYVRWDNLYNNPNWLWTWRCNQIDKSTPASENICNFDLKDISLGSPDTTLGVSLPSSFNWTKRGLSGDSYELILFDLTAITPLFETYPPLGNVNSYTMNFRPVGFDTNISYGWTVGVYTDDGWGQAYDYHGVTFALYAFGPRISGIVTQSGVPAREMPVYLRFWDGTSWLTFDSKTTDVRGQYTFNSLPFVSSGQAVYVRWDNDPINPSRLYRWWCYQISNASYIREYTCNFDLTNTPLVSPKDNAYFSVLSPFVWTSRGFSSDQYELDLYHPSGEPYFRSPLLGTANAYVLGFYPLGFTDFETYLWNIWTYTEYDGYGVSYETRQVRLGAGPGGQYQPSPSLRNLPLDNQPLEP